ncbi:MAG: gamma-glutamyl-gamma-aminobutyrate hydrolase family protein [Candidatus Carbobacillus sp.]|nr:gamma-glutamyl-gamma-aminobutyrate hydrolase family protein [Candidatus Carbobacillus sp.]
MVPRIGIVASLDEKGEAYRLEKTYVQAASAAGADIWILPYAEAQAMEEEALLKRRLDTISGLMLVGGGDIDPRYFGEEPKIGLGNVAPERDVFEIRLIQAAWKQGVPLLGICRGMQVMNVALGGTLYQDIHANVEFYIQHSQKAPKGHPMHRLTLAPDSYLQSVLGQTHIRVNSFHHQAVQRLAPSFKAIAWSSDGLIEAIESLRTVNGQMIWSLGVQWHPEALWAGGDPFSDRLFQAWINTLPKRV